MVSEASNFLSSSLLNSDNPKADLLKEGGEAFFNFRYWKKVDDLPKFPFTIVLIHSITGVAPNIVAKIYSFVLMYNVFSKPVLIPYCYLYKTGLSINNPQKIYETYIPTFRHWNGFNGIVLNDFSNNIWDGTNDAPFTTLLGQFTFYSLYNDPTIYYTNSELQYVMESPYNTYMMGISNFPANPTEQVIQVSNELLIRKLSKYIKQMYINLSQGQYGSIEQVVCNVEKVSEKVSDVNNDEQFRIGYYMSFWATQSFWCPVFYSVSAWKSQMIVRYDKQLQYGWVVLELNTTSIDQKSQALTEVFSYLPFGRRITEFIRQHNMKSLLFPFAIYQTNPEYMHSQANTSIQYGYDHADEIVKYFKMNNVLIEVYTEDLANVFEALWTGSNELFETQSPTQQANNQATQALYQAVPELKSSDSKMSLWELIKAILQGKIKEAKK